MFAMVLSELTATARPPPRPLPTPAPAAAKSHPPALCGRPTTCSHPQRRQQRHACTLAVPCNVIARGAAPASPTVGSAHEHQRPVKIVASAAPRTMIDPLAIQRGVPHYHGQHQQIHQSPSSSCGTHAPTGIPASP